MTTWKAHSHAIAVLTVLTSLAGHGKGHAAPQAGVRDALESQLGLHPGRDFRLADGKCVDCPTIPQAMFYFRDEVIAVPAPGLPVSGHSSVVRGKDDVRTWAAGAQAQALAYPGLVWLGAPQLLPDATFSADGASLRLPTGDALPWRLTPKIATNLSYFDASSRAFFGGKPVRVRGKLEQVEGRQQYTARTIWPHEFAIKGHALALEPLAGKDDLVAYVRAHDGGAKSAYIRTAWCGSASRAPPASGRASRCWPSCSTAPRATTTKPTAAISRSPPAPWGRAASLPTGS